MDISQRIKQYRYDKRYTQKELADLLNVKSSTVSGWELGRNIPSIDVIKKMADIFNVSFDVMAGVSNGSSNTKTADLADDDVIFTYQGKPLSDEDKELIKRLMNGKD